MAVLETTEAVVPGSNLASLTVKISEDSHCVYCKISGQKGKPFPEVKKKKGKNITPTPHQALLMSRIKTCFKLSSLSLYLLLILFRLFSIQHIFNLIFIYYIILLYIQLNFHVLILYFVSLNGNIFFLFLSFAVFLLSSFFVYNTCTVYVYNVVHCPFKQFVYRIYSVRRFSTLPGPRIHNQAKTKKMDRTVRNSRVRVNCHCSF